MYGGVLAYTQFMNGKKASLDNPNEYRLEAYPTLRLGVAAVSSW
jgi:hypothetical protein